jgi:hypothetical protein
MGLLIGVVTTAHHGTYGGVFKAHLVSLGLKHLEHVWVHIAPHWQVAGGGR